MIAIFGRAAVVSKIVSAIFGVGVCLLTYAITSRLTGNRAASWFIFLIVALNPLHIFNSASSMTDIPSAFFVMASLYFVIDKQWITAAVFGALAGLTRVDNWMLIALIPFLQFIQERRLSIVTLLILVFPPVFFFYVSWLATGDWWACFVIRKQYMDALLVANPSLASFSMYGIARDTGSLLISIGTAVLIACFIGGWRISKQILRSPRQLNSKLVASVFAVCVYFFAFFGFIVLAYLTHKQPIIFPRYGLTMFTLGLPLLAWTYLELVIAGHKRARKILIGIVTIVVLEAGLQFVGCAGFINKINTIETVAVYLRDHYQLTSASRIYSDDGTVIPLSGIPEERFLSTFDAPRDREPFLAWLKQKQVEYLVIVDKEDSKPAKLFPELKNGTGNDMFRPVMNARARFLPTNVWVYQVNLKR